MVWLSLLAPLTASAYEPPARVAVLHWKGTKTNYTTKKLQKKLRKKIDRNDSLFVPAFDLYQPGRIEKDTARSPTEQRARPSQDEISEVMALVEETAATSFDQLSEGDWGARAEALRAMADELWFIDSVLLREPLFILYCQIGRAAENSNQPSPPYYANVDGQAVNYYWFLAATLAKQDKTLLSKLLDQSLHRNVLAYKNQLDEGKFHTTTAAFSLDRIFDGAAFTSEYTLRINGFEQNLDAANGQIELSLGINDIALFHKDGSHGLSTRIERQTKDQGVDYIVETADKRMSLDLIEQLMKTPRECTPKIESDIANYLGVYSKLAEGAATYVAIPKFGKTSGKNLFVWFWDKGQLKLVSESCGAT